MFVYTNVFFTYVWNSMEAYCIHVTQKKNRTIFSEYFIHLFFFFQRSYCFSEYFFFILLLLEQQQMHSFLHWELHGSKHDRLV